MSENETNFHVDKYSLPFNLKRKNLISLLKKKKDTLQLISGIRILLKCVSSPLQVKRRLFHCVTITSLRLAAKVNEEEEVWVPGSSFQATFEGYGCITLEVSCRVCALGNAHPGKVITFPGSQLSLP